jgi:hypothetical protein
MAKVVRNHVYATPLADNLTLHLCGGIIQSENKVIRLTDEENAELEELIENGRVDLKQNLTKLDMKAAEETARKYLENQKPAAAKGSVTSADKPKSAEPPRTVNVPIPEGSSSTLAARLAATRENMMAAEADGAKKTEVKEEIAMSNEDLAKSPS